MMLRTIKKHIVLTYYILRNPSGYNQFCLSIDSITPHQVFNQIKDLVALIKSGEAPFDGQLTHNLRVSDVIDIPDFERNPIIINELCINVLCDHIAMQAQQHDVLNIVYYDRSSLRKWVKLLMARRIDVDVWCLAIQHYGPMMSHLSLKAIEHHNPMSQYLIA